MKKIAVGVVSLMLSMGPPVWSQAVAGAIYKDPKAAVPDRVRDLLGIMTLEEKVAQLQSQWVLPPMTGLKVDPIFVKGQLDDAAIKKIANSGLGTFVFEDEIMGLVDAKANVHQRNLLQAYVVKNTRLGIPILFHTEALHGVAMPGATSFPVPVALGSTWDRALLEQMFSTVAIEARASGNALVLAPVLDLERDPRYGRGEEMYSEDPYLVAQLGIAAVTGLQGTAGSLDEDHVYATAKHFVHGQPENGTNVGPSDFSERTMRSFFLYPFEQVVKEAHLEAVMPSYNETGGGIPSNANPWLLKDVLRKEWGFEGLTISDYLAVNDLNTRHHLVADNAAAGVLAFKSGVDMELPEASGYLALVAATKAGKISESEINAAAGRVLSAKFRAGLFEHPLIDEDRASKEIGTPEHSKLARKVADEAIVLLKNQDDILPLDPAKYKNIAVIGPNGKKTRLGGYSGQPTYYISMVDGIQKKVGQRAKVVFAEGCHISEPDKGPFINTMSPYVAPSEAEDIKLLEEAIGVAKNADVVVLALGGNESVSRESYGDIGGGNIALGDTDTLQLPGIQDKLVREIVNLKKPTVAVLLNGRAYAIEPLATQVPAILEGWYLGQETGNAVADVLFGDVNPSGHLPVTIARNVGQLPVFYYKTPAARRGYVFRDNTPLFPFGFGLSYTTFAFGKPTIDRESITTDGTARASILLTNTGSRAGDQVVQMYIHHVTSSVVQPSILLRGFQRVHLEPGASATVSFKVSAAQLAILDTNMKNTVETGAVEILIGPSSAETTSVRLTIAE